jgi:hypothetical protein
LLSYPVSSGKLACPLEFNSPGDWAEVSVFALVTWDSIKFPTRIVDCQSQLRLKAET